MIRFRRCIAIASIAVFLSVAGTSITWAKTAGKHALHSKVTAAQKQASDQLISQAISQLQSAQGSSASTAVTSALSDLTQALPIYHGYRVKAMAQCKKAVRQLSHPKQASQAQASISQALTDANTALQNSGSEVNETQ